MHHCLRVQELLALIFSHLDPREHSGQPTLQDLAVLARTCGTFHGPALDHLWRSSTIVNLLCCMPGDLWGVNEAKEPLWKCSMHLRRPIRAEDWNRVLVYAPRIQNLCSTSWDCDLSEVFPVISVCLPDQLLPNLQTLYWLPSDPNFHFIHLFLSPKITSIHFSGSSIPAISLLPTLTLKYPTLKDVSILSGEKQAVSVFLRSLECIESVHVDSLDHGALEHLSRLPTLTALCLNTLPSRSLSPRLDPQPFAVLRKLHLGSSNIEAITHFLRSCKEVPLRSLNFDVRTCPTTAESHEFYRALSASVSRSSLTEVDFDVGISNFDGNSPNLRIHRESIRLLIGFTNLVTISISSPVGVDLDDSTAADLARAWPRLEEMHMSSYGLCRSPPKATLECLHSFATWCPRLASLTITLDGTSAPAPQSPAPGTSQHALKSIHVAHSRISTEIMPVAQFLSAIFPELKRIMTSRDGFDNEDPEDLHLHGEAIAFHDLWKEVELLLVIQEVPAQNYSGV
ncbi:hypothetical protein C8J57DRAFT_1372855 [Mycena rebaudengoi]|nr:hypothetical protein C8J57DRAFT_1372855 [Mycena rebaudengoi]